MGLTSRRVVVSKPEKPVIEIDPARRYVGYARVSTPDQDNSGQVTRLDRLGRSLRELLETGENLKEQNIGLISLEEPDDTTSDVGELVFHVFGPIAHFERHLISQHTKDGIETARGQG